MRRPIVSLIDCPPETDLARDVICRCHADRSNFSKLARLDMIRDYITGWESD